MKKLIYFLICLYLIKIIVGQCFTENPSSVEQCKSQKTDDFRCCFIEYRTNKDPEYKKLCVGVNKTDIKKGRHEETIKNIETGNYTNSGWNSTIIQKFKDYCSIDNFDCKENYISKSLFLLSSLFIFLI